MPKVTVIVPVYNVEAFLKRCVDSVCGQTLRDLEIILVDDGSTDNSGALCEQLALTDERIRVIHQENQGLSGARNSGLGIAAGEYVSFIDSDDEIAPDMIEKLYNGLVGHHADVAECNLRELFADGSSKDNIRDMYDGAVSFPRYDLHDLLDGKFGTRFPVNVCSGLFKMSIIKQLHLRFVPTQTILAEDQMFSLCYFTQVRTAFFTKETMYYYYRRDESLTGGYTRPEILNRWISFVRELKAFLDRQDIPRQPFSVFAWKTWANVLRCTGGKSADYIREAFSMLSAENVRFLRRSLCNLIFGKSGRLYAENAGIRGKALLYQKYMWALMLFGKYEKPIRTNLAGA